MNDKQTVISWFKDAAIWRPAPLLCLVMTESQTSRDLFVAIGRGKNEDEAWTNAAKELK